MSCRACYSAVVLSFVLLFSSAGYAQTDMLDVVYLKDGSVVRGVIIEQIPGASIKIQTADQSVFVYQMDQIEKLTRVSASPRKGRKSASTAFLASLVLPGAGQYYNGQALKGVVIDVLFVGGAAMIIASSDKWDRFGRYDDSHRDVVIAGGALMAASYLWSLIDAPLSASAINRRRESTEIGRLFEWDCDSGRIGLGLSGIGRGINVSFSVQF